MSEASRCDVRVNSTSLRANRPAWVGTVALVVGLTQFLLLHLVVQSQWDPAYSWAHNNISDLGNAHCGPWGTDLRHVCSPWHGAFNVAFVVQGVAAFVGGIASRGGIGASRTATGLLAASGAGFVLVGVSPADVNGTVHLLGAMLIFFCGSAGLVALAVGRSSRVRGLARTLLAVAGLIGIAAAVLFLNDTYLGLGMGGMERIPVLLASVCLILAMAFVGRARSRGPQSATTIDVPP